MEILPSTTEQRTLVIFVFGAAITVGPAWAYSPAAGFWVALPWALVAFWQSVLVDVFFPPKEGPEDKFHDAAARAFERMGREHRWWNAWKQSKDIQNEKTNGLYFEVEKLRKEAVQAKTVKELQAEMVKLRAEVEDAKRPNTEGLLQPTADKFSFRRQDTKAEKGGAGVPSDDPLE